MRGTLADRFAVSRRGALVGRSDELARLRAFLADDDKVMAYVHGPGGVGKTMLLDALLGEIDDRTFVRVDCGDIEPSAEGLIAALDGVAPGAVVAIDRFEAAEALAAWFWRVLVPALPAGTQLVIAGRRPPNERWRADPAYDDCAVTIPLRNLAPSDAAALARARGATDEQLPELVKVTHGHPLALVIATDGTYRPPGGSGVLLDHPDAAARLLGRFLDEAITPLQRDALHVCGHARRVDRPMLAQVLELTDTEADDLLEWLRQRPYADARPDGLTLHDVVKDALDRDLRWRDRAAFARLHQRIREAVLARIAQATGLAQQRLGADLVHLHRSNDQAQGLYSFQDVNALIARPARSDDGEHTWVAAVFDEMEHRGAGARWWLQQQSARPLIYEDGLGRRAGVCLTVPLHDLTDADRAADPLLADLLEAVSRRRPPEPGEVLLHHMVAPRDRDPDLLPLLTDQLAATMLQEWLAPRLGWVVFASHRAEHYSPVWRYIGFEEIAAVEHDGEPCAVWARDFARSPIADWLAAMAAVELDDSGSVPPPVASPVALSREDFGLAVRRLLKDLPARDRVRRSPLLGSRLAAAGDDPAHTLRIRVEQAVQLLAQAPRLDTAARALDRTFLRPAGSQERAAEVLGLPFSTYRRHLATGLERLEALLWDWELHGPPAMK